MMIQRVMLLVLILLAVFLAGCRQETTATDNPDIEVDLVVQPDPPVVGESTLIVSITDASGAAISDAELELRGDMSHAGMTPVIRSVSEGSDGIYEVPFEWTMGGDWFVDVTVTRPDGSQDTERFNFSVGSGS